MNERIRVRNTKKFNVGIITPDKPYGQNIAPGAFTILNQDEIDYLISQEALSHRLSDGRCRHRPTHLILQVEGEKKEEVLESLGVDKENNANFMSDEDIKKKLSMNANQLKKWLESTEAEPYVLERVAEIASGMNLSMNKIQVLKDKIPNFEFIK